MDLIEVDPKLFVTCRLCLEELGQYQIVPIVQEQIKYCFDIDVEPFDGLPQLICLRCKKVLSNFYSVKKNLCEKQNNLRDKVLKQDVNSKELCVQPQHDAVSSSQPAHENINNSKRSKSITRRIHSSDSEDSLNVLKVNKKSKSSKSKRKWDWTGYKKMCVCTICNSEWSNLKSMAGHQRIHTCLKAVYPNIFKNNCSVVLNKIDKKPNFTGQNNIVVHSSDKIIEQSNALYYISYSKPTVDSNASDGEASKKQSQKNDSASTDTEFEFKAKPKRRKRQLLSKSSNETLVIEANIKEVETKEGIKTDLNICNVGQEAQSSNNQCINIEDSSDSDADKQKGETIQRVKQPLEAQLGDFKIIQGIITMCVNAYHRKNESVEKTDKPNSSESHLKHKVLSIGRKIINRQGCNWTGLLRYLEHKNLDIVWSIKPLPTSNTKEANYIRIMAKLRGMGAMDDSQGWQPVAAHTPVHVPDSSLSVCRPMPPVTQNLNNTQTAMDSAILFICNPPDSKSKLLNANPVANPKQLPKKFGQTSEPKINKPSAEIISATFQNNEENDTCMPIITSTTSLAVSSATENLVNESATKNSPPVTTSSSTTDTPALPRIKVKPVTELMSERILKSLRKEELSAPISNMLASDRGVETDNNQVENANNVVGHLNVCPQNGARVYISNVVTQPAAANQSIQLVPVSCVNITSGQSFQAVSPMSAPTTSTNTNNKEEFVLLNTVELPNTKTNSPFRYLQKLLQMYDIVIMDPLEVLPREFVCLIKFKVKFKQEPIDEPVVLCLSLYNYENQFCFTVKDRHQREINIDKISPNWQWEILNVFRGDLVDVVLQNAEKQGPETHRYTMKFMCLLKSICFKKLS